MSSILSTPSRKWIAASTLALVVAGGAVASNVIPIQPAHAQVSVPAVEASAGFADLVEAVSPAVVSVRVRGEVPQQQFTRRGPNFEFEFPDLPENHPLRRFFDQFEGPGGPFGEPGSPRPNRPRQFMQAVGSGFLISGDGYIVTNNHVVEGASEVTVLLNDDTELAVDVVGTDPRTDLAVLKVQEDRNDLPFVEFAEAEARVGDWVVAVGNPFGLGGTVTAGIVSASGRDIRVSAYDDFIQIDAAINRGNSGGPSFNLEGKVIGVNTAIYSPSGGNVGIAFAIPTSVVQDVIDQLIDNGAVTRGFLGVSLQDLNDDLAEGLGLANTNGALVTEPIEGAPAGEAGVQSGDVIVTVDGQAVRTSRELSRLISQRSPGTSVELGIIRDSAELDIAVTLDRLPEDEQAAPTPQAPIEEPEAGSSETSIGVIIGPNPDGDGVLVEDVVSDSVAAARGLGAGDIILEIDGETVNSVSSFNSAVDAVRDSGRTAVPLKVTRDGVVRFLGIPLEE
ncbi:Do family serine endopeptidase [Pelagibacterium sediminicola]|uniref:Do family serine endopeptidase n=1 Tax=Pelagibacterium sediminicola TaxID=2248761 RepID=UPI000E30BC23|nr:Do family serine endopeptidase [Pelagibacterium sediminicola]